MTYSFELFGGLETKWGWGLVVGLEEEEGQEGVNKGGVCEGRVSSLTSNQ